MIVAQRDVLLSVITMLIATATGLCPIGMLVFPFRLDRQ